MTQHPFQMLMKFAFQASMFMNSAKKKVALNRFLLTVLDVH